MKKKVVYVCPRCGKSRILRSNSRPQMCPYCDSYNESQDEEASGTSRRLSGLEAVFELGEPHKTVYYESDTKKLVLYSDGVYSGSGDIERWAFQSGYQVPDAHRAAEDRTIAVSILEFLENNGKSEKTDDLESIVASMYRKGMHPVSISMSLNISFSDVMDYLKK